MAGVGSGGSLTTSHCARINETTAAVRSEFSKEGVAGVVGGWGFDSQRVKCRLDEDLGTKIE